MTVNLYHVLQNRFECEIVQCDIDALKHDYDFSLNVGPPQELNSSDMCWSRESRTYIFEVNEKPHLSLLVDPGFHYPDLLHDPFLHFGCDDRYSVDWFHRLGHENAFFCPHAIEKELVSEDNNTSDKKIPIIFLGSYMDEVEICDWWKETLPSASFKRLMDVVEEITSPPYPFFWECIEKLVDAGDDFSKYNLKSICNLLHQMEGYIKGWERKRLLQILKDFPVCIYGNSYGRSNWKEYAAKYLPNAIVRDGVNHMQSLALLKESKISISGGCKTYFGAHERIFNSLACGACPIADPNDYLRKTFSDGMSIIFSLPQEKLSEKVEKVLEDDSYRQSMVETGQNAVRRYHTWEQISSIVEDWTLSHRFAKH